jgi:predicted dehydrogenase
MRRRSFLKATAIGGVATAVGPNLLFGQATKPSERIGVALIGASNMGGKTHLPTLIGEDRIQLRAICDVDSEVVKDRLAKAKEGYAAKTGQAGYKGIDGLGDFRELLTRDDIDAVVIATPDQWHVPMAKAFVKAGKAVYLEKPLSLFVPEGRELVDLVEKHEAVVQVGTQRRSQDQTIIACELVRNGVIGKIKHVDVVTGTRSGKAEKWKGQEVPPNLDYEMWVGPGPMTPYHVDRVHYNFRFVSEYSGGDVTNMGAHHFDVAQWGLGVDRSGPVKVSGTGKRNPEGSIHDVFFECDVDFEYANGATLRFKSADEHWNKDGVTFHGENGTINAMRKLTSEPAELVRTSRDDFKVKFRKTPGSHMPNWVQCILDNKPENLHAPVEVGHRSVTACHLVNLAMLTGRELEWDPEMERFKNDDEANKLLTRKPREGWVF